MPSPTPKLVIRLGSHAEKEYVTKLAQFLDGMIVGANLFEATPGATASLLVKIGAKSKSIYLDPMTYAFGTYVDKDTGALRKDLDWIKSDQVVRGGKKGRPKETIRDFKRSYKSLAERLGDPLAKAVRDSRAVLPSDFKDPAVREKFCRTVANYQITRIADEFQEDEELSQFVGEAPSPAAIFAPYFYIEPSKTGDWLALNIELIRTAASLGLKHAVHGVICADVSHLADDAFRKAVVAASKVPGLSGLWLWFSGFFEDDAAEELLVAYRELVRAVSKSVSVYSMHGGYFSLAMCKHGMEGVSHGIGYGEQKDVVPVIGQSTPTVRYYLPALAKRLGVPEIERAFDGLGIVSAADFHQRVCGCAVCRGIVVDSIDEFRAFGEMHYSREESKRRAQTPAAAKRCRFHFLLSRIKERDELQRMDLAAIVQKLEDDQGEWGNESLLDVRHLGVWRSVLSGS